MSLRTKFVGYLLALHLVFAVFAVYVLRHQRVWLLGVEAVLILSFIVARRLHRSMFRPLELLVAGADMITDSDFTSTFRGIGQAEMDQLIAVYNRMILTLRDERIHAEEQHHFMDKLLRASPAGIIIFDYDGRIDLVNPVAADLLGVSSNAPTGQLPGQLGTPLASAIDGLPVGGSRVVTLYSRRRFKCSRSEFHYRGFPRSFIVIEELTEELRRSEKDAYEKLIRVMSHEINNSIAATTSLLQSCLNYRSQIDENDRQDFESALQVAIERMAHLNEFMRGFADVVRLPPPRFQSCDLRHVLENIALLMRPECDRRRIDWRWAIESPLGLVRADPGLLEQALVNIVKNALEAIEQDGCITIRFVTQQGKRAVIVEDTGRGFTSELKDNLFTPFFSTKAGGQGIGLTMVQEILSLHGFDFRLESEAGEPTRFTILVT
ncbi:MAG: PAS domain-containing protein [candidate division Zixibacteria bacterium]|nr:PAS domain-containing protein [candidate division Zixibacteria bacterium]